MEFPDRGPRELDKRGVLMGSVGGTSQLDHVLTLGLWGSCLWCFPGRASGDYEQRRFSCRTLSAVVSSAK